MIRDIVNVATRRMPNAHLLLFPARVQGAESAGSLARAIRRVSSTAPDHNIDVCIVARGGGSLEDLWGFNDERVARAIAECTVPVVSGVGHQTDTTIADFVSDRRAPTPSAAAELVFPVRRELSTALQDCLNRGARALQRSIEARRLRLKALEGSLGDGRAVIQAQQQGFAEALLRMEHAVRRRFEASRRALKDLETRLARLHPEVRIRELRAEFAGVEQRLGSVMTAQLKGQRTLLAGLARNLNALSPLQVLERGYSITLDASGRALVRADQVKVGDGLDIRLAQGNVRARVEHVKLSQNDGKGPSRRQGVRKKE